MGLGDQKYFITNTGELLRDVIDNALRESERVDVLVGYFLLSGLQKLNEEGALEGKKVRILVGMRARLTPQGREEAAPTKGGSVKEQREFFYDELRRTMNAADDYGIGPMSESYRLLLDKVKRGELLIRQSAQECHAKLYVFHYNATLRDCGHPGVAIMGSSNLSTAGLCDRIEVNRRFADNEAYEAGSSIFEELWEEGIDLLSEGTYDEFVREVVDKTWLGKMYSPYEFYLRVLHEFFSREDVGQILKPSDISPAYADLKYQTDAIASALRSLRLYRGVILADVVGLGKSVIAACVARNMNMPVTVICPPHLINQWLQYGHDYALIGLRVFSTGALLKLFEEYCAYADVQGERLIIVDEAHRFRNSATESYALLHKICARNRVMLLTATPFNNQPNDIYSLVRLFQVPSHPTLPGVGRLDYTFKRLQDKYEELRKARKVKPRLEEQEQDVVDEEIYSDGESDILEAGGVLPDDSASSDAEIMQSGEDSTAPDKSKVDEISMILRDLIAPIVIRRSRIDLQRIAEYREDLERQGFMPITPEAPLAHDYELGDLEELYLSTIESITLGTDESAHLSYQAVRYAPLNFVQSEALEELKSWLSERGWDIDRLRQQQKNIVSILRRMLVRRFESSVAAFKKSLRALIRGYEKAIMQFDKEGRVVLWQTILKGVELQGDTESDGEEKREIVGKRKGRKVEESVSARYFSPAFRVQMQSDLEKLQNILARWEEKLPDNAQDPKMQEFIRLMRELLAESPTRKVVVFSEFSDTVEALAAALRANDFNVMHYTSLEATNKKRGEVLQAFDASSGDANSLVRVLVTTDALSEGVNLNLADTVFNYDIPYNPTRVVQRVGRINRINQRVHEKLYIHNFFPSYIGEKQVSVRRIARLKVAFIHATMGDDTRILDPDETIRSFKERVRSGIDEELRQDDVESWDTFYRVELEKARATEAYARALEIPTNARTARQAGKGMPMGMLLYGRAGSESRFSFALMAAPGHGMHRDSQGVRQIGAQMALPLFRASAEEKPLEAFSEGFAKRYEQARKALFFREIIEPTLFPMEKKARDRVRLEIIRLQMAGQGRQAEVSYLKRLDEALQKRAFSSKDIMAVLKTDFKKKGALAELQERIPEVILLRIMEMLEPGRGQGEELVLLAEELAGVQKRMAPSS